jgi:Polysaccharide biosynthesis enzyme WcbI
MKFAVVSNCQAIPLGKIMRALRPDDQVSAFEVHLLGHDKEMYKNASHALDTAEIIIYAPVGDDYPVDIVRSSNIRNNYKQPKICIPAFYFRGLQPDAMYLGSSGERFQGPMHDYHSEIILESFLSGISENDAIQKLFSPEEHERRGYFSAFSSSLSELRHRDAMCDIKCVPIIEKFVYDFPTFFTINHPTNLIIWETAKHIFNMLSLPFFHIPLEFLPAGLESGPIWPPNETIANFHKLKYGGSNILKTVVGGQRFIKYSELTFGSYSLYKSRLSSLVVQPQVTPILRRINKTPENIIQHYSTP